MNLMIKTLVPITLRIDSSFDEDNDYLASTSLNEPLEEYKKTTTKQSNKQHKQTTV